MDYTLRQASEKSGKSVDALRRAIKAGRLTATMGEKGYVIDQYALDDFDAKPAAEISQVTKQLAAEVETLTATLEAAYRRIDELERDKEQLSRAFEVMTDSIAASTRSRPALDATPTAPKRRPWRWRSEPLAK